VEHDLDQIIKGIGVALGLGDLLSSKANLPDRLR